jgi:pyrroline-5-carboxylate reductase
MALKDETLAFIGCGNMGEAMVKGLLRERLVTPAQLVASHPRADRRAALAGTYGIATIAANGDAAAAATITVLCIKPQFLGEVLSDLQGRVAADRLVISIVAGARLERVATALGTAKVVRAMPNTPGQIGEGITVWTRTPAVGDDESAKVRAILSALGEEEHVTHENELDMATALSGTGPAYVFLFMEAMVDAGVHMGFSRRVASRLVLETVRGSVDYAAHASDHLARLRNQVTSPGGTTAEALYQLEKGGLRTVLSDAVWAAYRRCVALGQAKPE